MKRPLCRLPLLFLLVVATSSPAAAKAVDEQRFVFSWPYTEGDTMAPRGGTSRGAAVTLAGEPGQAWRDLRAEGLSDFERDRRAILAMAGGYRASFDFIEVEGYSADFEPDRPYQSWGTEYVYVIADEGDFISLQHILVMVFETGDGPGEPMVMKHWRQDWRYEDTEVLAYAGHGRFTPVSLPAVDVKGQWSQAVYQVDDSPRYESVGRWRHLDDFSTWSGDEAWRPLPRREFSVRDDYQVLVGRNAHTITPLGWTHRQDNVKTVLDDDGQVTAQLARELGVNRYQAITGFDFSAGDAYLARTEPFWAAVREAFAELQAAGRSYRLRSSVDDRKLYEVLFEYAGGIGEDGEAYDAAAGRAFARQTVTAFVTGEGAGDTDY